MAEHFTERELRYKRREAIQEEIERLQKEKEKFDEEQQREEKHIQRQRMLSQTQTNTVNSRDSVRERHGNTEDKSASSKERELYHSAEDPRTPAPSLTTMDITGYFDQELFGKIPIFDQQQLHHVDVDPSLDLSAETEALDQMLTKLNIDSESVQISGKENRSEVDANMIRNSTPVKKVTINTEPYENIYFRDEVSTQKLPSEIKRRYYRKPQQNVIHTNVEQYHYRLKPTEERDFPERRTDIEENYDGNSDYTGVISDNEILEYQRSIMEVEAEKMRLDQLKAKQNFTIQYLVERKKQMTLQKEMKRKEEERLMKSIHLLEIKEKELEEKERESANLKAAIDESEAEDKAIDNRIKILRLKEEETRNRISKKEIDKPDEKAKIKAADKVEAITIEKTLLGKPYLPAFEGKNYEDWRMEVSCLIKSNMYQEKVLAQAIRNSLKGQTRKILLSMNPAASSIELMDKLEEVYGNLKESDTLLQDFFSAWQNPTESSSDWGIRIENLFQRVVQKGEVDELNRNSMLKRKFWRALHSDKLKEALRVSFESEDTFEVLRKKARREEEEIESRRNKESVTMQYLTEDVKPKIQQPVRTNTETDAKLDKLLERMKELEDRMKTMSVQKQYSPKDFLQNRYSPRYMNDRRQRGRSGYRNQGRRGQGLRRDGNEGPKQEPTKTDKEQEQKSKEDKKQPLNQ